jgi:hypothetical protein
LERDQFGNEPRSLHHSLGKLFLAICVIPFATHLVVYEIAGSAKGM